MMKKIFKIVLRCLGIIILFLLVFLAAHLFDWQGRYSYNHDFITIMGEEYFFDPSLILHSEEQFRNVSVGTTYEELVKKFGRENGQLNSNGIKNAIYYALAEDRFIVFQLASFRTNENGITGKNRVVWRMYICDDEERLELLDEDWEIYNAALQTWKD